MSERVQQQRTWSGRRQHLAMAGAVLLYNAALVIWLTWPLAPAAGTNLPATAFACKFDTLYSGWVLAHEARTLFSHPTQLAHANIFHPTANALFYGPTAFGALPYFAPVFLATGNPTLALNFVFLASLILTGCALHFVVWRWTGSHLGGMLAALTYFTTPWTLLQWLPTTPHFSVLQYLPLIIFLAAQPIFSWRRAIALLLLCVLQCLTDLVYVSPALLGPLAGLGVLRALRRPTRRAGLMLIGVVIVAGLFLLVPAYGNLQVRALNPGLNDQVFWVIDRDWFRQNGTEIPRGFFGNLAPTALQPVAFVLIATGTLLFFANRQRDAVPWRAAAWWTIVGVLMSLTPIVRWRGAPYALPHAWLMEWTSIYTIVRVPPRLGVGALMGLCLLVGLAFAECARWVSRRQHLPAAALLRAALAGVIAVVMYAESAGTVGSLLSLRSFANPLPYISLPAPAVDPALRAALTASNGPLLELPATLTRPALAPGWHARAMYRSIFHGRPLLNGYSSYWPAEFSHRMRLADQLPDPVALETLERLTGVELIWVHANELGGATRQRWLELADAGGGGRLRLIARSGDELLFAVTEHMPHNEPQPDAFL